MPNPIRPHIPTLILEEIRMFHKKTTGKRARAKSHSTATTLSRKDQHRFWWPTTLISDWKDPTALIVAHRDSDTYWPATAFVMWIMRIPGLITMSKSCDST